jgi:hypothetical protein
MCDSKEAEGAVPWSLRRVHGASQEGARISRREEAKQDKLTDTAVLGSIAVTRATAILGLPRPTRHMAVAPFPQKPQ